MNTNLLLADLILLLHALVVVFILGGWLLILIGGLRHWHWVRNLWFRLTHLAAIGFVIVQSWLGQLCPLTILENQLRVEAGATPYAESFIQYWLSHLLYYNAPDWVFVTLYTLFGLLVAASWWRFPPEPQRKVRR